MILAFYISGHGFGHATRDIEIINHVLEREPGARIAIRTAVPSWFLEQSIRGPFELHAGDVDTGMVQIDGLTLDVRETVERARDFYRTLADRVRNEVAFLRAIGASLVVGDIPPLAFAAAAAAGVPGVGVANFTWDWIYGDYPEFASAPETLASIRHAYAATTLALRLPFSGGFEAMRSVTHDIPLVARRSRRDPRDTRRALHLDDRRPVVLASFGGYGVPLPFARIARDNDITLVVTGHEVGPEALTDAPAQLRVFRRDDFRNYDLQYEDLVAAADVVVSKPGYGIVSECIANGASLLYTSRGRFVEHEVFVAEMPRVLRCRFIEQDEMLSGSWDAAIQSLLAQPAPASRLDTNGAAIAADRLLAAAAAQSSQDRLL